MIAAGTRTRRHASPGWSNVKILVEMEPVIAKCTTALDTGLQIFCVRGLNEVNDELPLSIPLIPVFSMVQAERNPNS